MKLKRILTLVVVLMAVVALPGDLVFGQAPPEFSSAVIVGPVSIDGEVGLQVGYSKKVLGVYLVGSGQFGKTAEGKGEVIKLFKISGRFYAGPVAGGGIDWSDRPGTGGVPTEAYVFGAVGGVATYGFTDRIGSWLFWKGRTESKPTLGLGLYLRL